MSNFGRPQIQIDWDQFEKLCRLQCTKEEISEWFKCSQDTIERAVKRKYKQTFAVTFGQKRTTGCISLRRKMFELALGGNVTLLIWLSKQYLGMTDKVESKEIEKKEEYTELASMRSSQQTDKPKDVRK